MKITDAILILGILASIFQIFLLVRRFSFKETKFIDISVLNSTCLILVGTVFHFYFGFPLDEGILKYNELESYELRLIVSDTILVVGCISAVLIRLARIFF